MPDVRFVLEEGGDLSDAARRLLDDARAARDRSRRHVARAVAVRERLECAPPPLPVE